MGERYSGPSLEQASRLATAADILGLPWSLHRRPGADKTYAVEVADLEDIPADEQEEPPKSTDEKLLEMLQGRTEKVSFPEKEGSYL